VKIGATLSILAERELVHPASGRRLAHALEEIGRATVIQVAEPFRAANSHAWFLV
jgi:hypothetical protein